MTASVVFLNPPVSGKRKLMRNFDCASESKGNYLYQPYDFLLLSAKIPKSWKLIFLDAVAEHYNTQDLISKCESNNPLVIVIAMADANWNKDLEFLKRIKKLFADKYILVFGDSFFEQSAIDIVRPYVSGVIDNPLDVDFSEYADPGLKSTELSGIKSFSKLEKVSKKPKSRLLGLPRHESFVSKSYRWPFAEFKRYTTVFTAWGCPYSCSYCIMAKFPNLYRPVNDVIEELDYVHELGYKEIYIGDRSFGLPKKNVESILLAMIQKKYNFRWSSYFHPNQYDPKTLELMKESGCHTLIIGIESKKFDHLKNFSRTIRHDDFYNLLNHSKRLGIKICGDFLIGLPGESYDDVIETIKFSCKIPIDYASFNIVAPLSGSSIRSEAIKEGKLNENDRHFDSLGAERVLASDKLSSRELLFLRNYAVKRFYLRPTYLFKRLITIKSFEQFFIQFQEMLQLFKKSKLLGVLFRRSLWR